MNRSADLLALLVLAAFLGILVWKVPRLDLGVLVLLTILVAAADLARAHRWRR